VRPFLKWLGGKYRLIDDIVAVLPAGTTLAEPFVGAGAVFLNTNYEHYILNDLNDDLIMLYKNLQTDSEYFIRQAKSLFSRRYNNEKQYYKLREKFNYSDDHLERSLLFLYMNRHGYNGLCRYNQQKIFNVPFGRYLQPYFPKIELEFFAEQVQKATLYSMDFEKIFAKMRGDCVIYCDPPYVPLSQTANFTAYHGGGFSLHQQQQLAKLAEQAAKNGVPTVISNNYNDITKQLYKKAKINLIQSVRTISCNITTRKSVTEILALYDCVSKRG
jgi:DNA adenine methylase